MALLTAQAITVAGTPPTFVAAAAGGDTCRPHGVLVVKNGGAGSVTVTAVVPGNLVTGDAYPDKAYTVAAGAEAWIPILREYRDPSTGVAAFAYSGVTSVTVAHVDVDA